MTVQLLPCPFCGSEPLEDRIEPHKHYLSMMPDYPGSWSIECPKCEFRLFDHDSHDNVVKAWNTRQAALSHASATAEECSVVGESRSFQSRVSDWMGLCFVPSLYSDMTERGDRLLEEVLELLQAHGYDRSRVATLVEYVYGRATGEPAQEVGGVMVTLAGYCWIAGLDMHAAGEKELTRICQPDVMAKIRAKQEAKNALHFDTPLPGQVDQAIAAKRGG